MAKDFVKTIIDTGAVDSEGNVPIMEISGQFRTPEVKVLIGRNKFTADFAEVISGQSERVNFHSHLVNEEHRIMLKLEGGREFFGIG